VAELRDDWGREMVAADLTEPWAFRGGARPRDIYLRLKGGMDGTPMPAYAQSADDDELWNLTNYVLSLARKPAWQMSAVELRALYAQRDADAKANPVKWGSYLIYRQGCLFCHTPIREDGSLVEPLRLAGGQLWRVGAYGDFVSYNLTSDEETGLGKRTDDEIKRVITTGVRHDGSRMLPLLMPWHAYSHLRDFDLDAIVAYLRTLPPVRNHIPPPQSPNIATYLWRKFRMLILREDLPLVTYPGNAGRLEEERAG
jgi:mono/diheme cytochrome c family protein